MPSTGWTRQRSGLGEIAKKIEEALKRRGRGPRSSKRRSGKLKACEVLPEEPSPI